MIVAATVFILIGVVMLGISVYASYVLQNETDQDKRKIKFIASITGFGFILLSFLAFGTLYGIPQYKVWQQQKEGEARLAEAEQSRKILIEEAKAKEESAMHLAQAKIINAQSDAKSNQIISDSLQDNYMYLHYMWIRALENSKNQIIYIPSNGGIPILEANRFQFTNNTSDDK